MYPDASGTLLVPPGAGVPAPAVVLAPAVAPEGPGPAATLCACRRLLAVALRQSFQRFLNDFFNAFSAPALHCFLTVLKFTSSLAVRVIVHWSQTALIAVEAAGPRQSVRRSFLESLMLRWRAAPVISVLTSLTTC